MKQVTITAKTSASDKESFDEFCSNVGLTTSVAINLFIKAVLRENKIPFEISQTPDSFYEEANILRIKKSASELRAGKGIPHELIEVDDE